MATNENLRSIIPAIDACMGRYSARIEELEKLLFEARGCKFTAYTEKQFVLQALSTGLENCTVSDDTLASQLVEYYSMDL